MREAYQLSVQERGCEVHQQAEAPADHHIDVSAPPLTGAVCSRLCGSCQAVHANIACSCK